LQPEEPVIVPVGTAPVETDEESTDDQAEIERIIETLPNPYQRSYLRQKLAEAELERRGFPPPPDVEADTRPLPNDIAEYSRDQLSGLYAKFINARASSRYYQVDALTQARLYKSIADHLHNQIVMTSTQTNEQKRTADAETDERVVIFRQLELDADNIARRYDEVANDLSRKAAGRQPHRRLHRSRPGRHCAA
jgi:hypothetical protein